MRAGHRWSGGVRLLLGVMLDEFQKSLAQLRCLYAMQEVNESPY